MKNVYKKPKKNRKLVSADYKALVGATNSVITKGDVEFLSVLNRDYHFEIGEIGDYVFSAVSSDYVGIVDFFFANDLVYIDLPEKPRDRIFVKFEEEIFKKIAFGNRESDEMLVAVFEYRETIGRLEFMKYKDIIASIYYDGYLAKMRGLLVLYKESE